MTSWSLDAVRDEIVPTAGSEIWETGGSLKIGMDADGGFSIIRCDRTVSTRREDSGTEAPSLAPHLTRQSRHAGLDSSLAL